MTESYLRNLEMMIYQIYPRSFFDTNHDGIGDLNGVIAKLDYLADLGVNAIWLCPCFKSPNEDNGYDISDYRDIMDEFGTLDDMKRLIKESHGRGIKVILDLVANHTSSEHEWFKESRTSRDNQYSDYYYWFDEPQNDWKSAFLGSAWEYEPKRNQYYLHSFAVGQPDINWENPKVVAEMQGVVDFWSDLGVDGFRCDVIDFISKDFAGDKKYLGPKVHEYIHDLFGREKVKHLFTVGECSCKDIDEVYRHCAEHREELTTLFQFDHINKSGRENKFTPRADSLTVLRDILISWQHETEKRDIIYSLFSDNHDNSWMLSRIGNDKELRFESASCIATMLYMLKGAAFIYQGQEIGMAAAHYDTIDVFDDIESRNKYADFCQTMSPEQALAKINFGSRDNTRHPFAWDDTEFGGFSDTEPWLIPHNRYKEINLKNDLSSKKSVFRFYQKLLALRKNSKAVIYGDFTVLSKPEDKYFVFERTLNDEIIRVICNFEQPSEIAVPKGEILLSNYQNMTFDFAPYEIRVIKL